MIDIFAPFLFHRSFLVAFTFRLLWKGLTHSFSSHLLLLNTPFGKVSNSLLPKNLQTNNNVAVDKTRTWNIPGHSGTSPEHEKKKH